MTKPHTFFRRVLLSSALAALLLPGAALAAPDRTITLNSATAEAAWDGPEVEATFSPSYAPEECTKDPDAYCDQTLVKIDSASPVKIDAAIGDYSMPLADFDLYVYKSNEKGTATEDDVIHGSFIDGEDSGWPNGFEESATAENQPAGYYLVVVVYYDTHGSSYHGTFKITGATPTADGGGTTPPPSGGGGTPPPSGGGTQPAPTAAPAPTELPLKAATMLGSAKKAKKTRKLKFKVTAGDNITNLSISLTKGKKVLGKAKIAFLPKGTRRITLKVSRKIKRGSYVLASQGTVNGNTLRKAQKVKVKR